MVLNADMDCATSHCRPLPGLLFSLPHQMQRQPPFLSTPKNHQ
ncbi:hypothetical protein PCIT_a0016 [Pseudoalteromonas citrea]|uniref:Uncharacterized protein n=1 Tax=Pseudoalteromonas citrea TaxID=43655 RepID=A0AAD4FSN4_9GAMM|nr:hypothetical protein PCIT_a0016 [Pseudoalteromonas citrea]